MKSRPIYLGPQPWSASKEKENPFKRKNEECPEKGSFNKKAFHCDQNIAFVDTLKRLGLSKAFLKVLKVVYFMPIKDLLTFYDG